MTRVNFNMDISSILDEAIDDPARANSSFNRICSFWKSNGVLYARLPVRREVIEVNKKVKAIHMSLGGRPLSPGTKLLVRAIQKSRRQPLPYAQPSVNVHLNEINNCSDMAMHSNEFTLAIVSENQAREFEDPQSDKNCRHCNNVVEVISWKFVSDSCVIAEVDKEESERKAREKAMRFAAKASWPIPIESSPRERWDQGLRGQPKLSSEIILVDQYAVRNFNNSAAAVDFITFLDFLDEDFSKSNIADQEITIYTTFDDERFEISDFETWLWNVVKDRATLREKPIVVHLFRREDDQGESEDKFPRDRWLGFDDHRFEMHGIDFLTKARHGEGVHWNTPGSPIAEDDLETERMLKRRELGQFLDIIKLPK